MSKAELGDLMDRFAPLEVHFNRYLMIGGFLNLYYPTMICMHSGCCGKMWWIRLSSVMF